MRLWRTRKTFRSVKSDFRTGSGVWTKFLWMSASFYMVLGGISLKTTLAPSVRNARTSERQPIDPKR